MNIIERVKTHIRKYLTLVVSLKTDITKKLIIKEPMTLCISKINKKGNVEFWTDSRLNYSNNTTIDMGIKVISYPVTIYNILDKTSPDYNQNWGMCFAGGGQTVYYIKDFITENLKNLEYSPDFFDISADIISNFISKIYQIACQKFIDKLTAQEGGCVLLTTGYCPIKRQFITYKYIIKIPIDYDNIEIEKIELKDDIDFIGSGTLKAKELYEQGLTNPYQIMKKIIDENLVHSVGGQIQFGETVNMDFKIKGVIKTEQNKVITQLRGVNLYDNLIFDYTKDLKPTTTFLVNLDEIK